MIRRFGPHILVCALLVAEIGLLLVMPPPRLDDRVGIRSELPDAIGQYQGSGIMFCQDSQCRQQTHRLSELDGALVCPACGGELDEWSLSEKYWFPADTTVVRKEYRDGAGERFFVAIVISGKERRSIHRPEVCLSAQGNSFPARRVVPVPVEGRSSLNVTVLDLSRTNTGQASGCYAYWFLTEGRETPRHLERLFWMAWDGLVHGERRRWAYIAVSTSRRPEGEEHLEKLRGFIGALYPYLVAGEKDD